jgi:hypothetical protein
MEIPVEDPEVAGGGDDQGADFEQELPSPTDDAAAADTPAAADTDTDTDTEAETVGG